MVSAPQCVLPAPAGQVNEQVSCRMASSGGRSAKRLVSGCPVTFALSPLKSRKLETPNSCPAPEKLLASLKLIDTICPSISNSRK